MVKVHQLVKSFVNFQGGAKSFEKKTIKGFNFLIREIAAYGFLAKNGSES